MDLAEAWSAGSCGDCTGRMSVDLTRESDVLYSVRTLLEAVGFSCYRLAQGRMTRQSAGLPDLYALHPTKGALWVECKRPDGRRSAAQSLFAARCIRAGVGYVCCSKLETMQAYLTQQGIIASSGRSSKAAQVPS